MNEDDVPIESSVSYTVTETVSMTGVTRETLIEYCEQGLLPMPAEAVDDSRFDDHLINLIRRVEALRTIHGVNLTGIQMIVDLSNEVESLRRELRFRVDAEH